jgi:predicted RNase H-like HicB family nuclease
VNIFSRNASQPKSAHVDLPILVRFWYEDDVWNASAFDLPVAVFGNSFDEARSNMEEALDAHFELLVEMNRATITVKKLKRIAEDRGFYDRIQPRETVEKFMLPELELSLG